MFELLSRVLLWLLLGSVLVSLFQRFPSGSFAGRFLLVIIVLILLLAFIDPSDPTVSALWEIVSFPLKPLGASVLLLMFAAQKMKGGGIEKPGGYLVGWALTILLLASTPAVVYFLNRSAMIPGGSSNIALTESSSETLVALAPGNEGIANDMGVNAPYLAQIPTSRSRLALDSFIPNARTLTITTEVWERYLRQLYVFLRG